MPSRTKWRSTHRWVVDKKPIDQWMYSDSYSWQSLRQWMLLNMRKDMQIPSNLIWEYRIFKQENCDD